MKKHTVRRLPTLDKQRKSRNPVRQLEALGRAVILGRARGARRLIRPYHHPPAGPKADGTRGRMLLPES